MIPKPFKRILKIPKIFRHIIKRIYTQTVVDSQEDILPNEKSDYLTETENVIKRLQKISLTDFWKWFIYGRETLQHGIKYANMYIGKFPMDILLYPTIISNSKPEVIVEIGTKLGGSAIFFSDMSEKVITVDINEPPSESLDELKKRGIVFVKGDINSPQVIDKIIEVCKNKNCMVIDDGSHNEIDIYNAFLNLNHLVKKDGFYIIEDGITNRILLDDFPHQKNTQPINAISKILSDFPEFKLEEKYDRYLLTSTLKGVLKRV